MKDSQVLKEVKRRLIKRPQGHFFLCCLVDEMFHEGKIDIAQRNSLKEWFMSMIHPYGTYGEWLGQNHREASLRDGWTRAGRAAWLDWMIAYCKERGQ